MTPRSQRGWFPRVALIRLGVLGGEGGGGASSWLRWASWLSKNADPEHSRLRGVALVMRYAEIRAYHGESTTLATAFWIGAAIWGLGVIGICTFLAVVGD